MNIKLALILPALAASFFCQAQETVFEKELTFPDDATNEEKISLASRLVPDARQRAWQDRELTAFLHFGMNTFTNREWGDGKESPMQFQPDSLDTDQWVKTLHDAGFKLVILTCKHHDGFCLWQTKTTPHSVASSSWRDGKGDVLADLRRSCDKYGMKLGVYLSPWDRNAPVYGEGTPYNDLFVAQLTELLTNYGKIDEVWFDGACGEGPNGKRQQYDWLRYRNVMKQLQPEAVLAITGDDVRWVGNESGNGRETEWSVTPLVPAIYSYADSVNNALGIHIMANNIGDRETIYAAKRLYWWPSEVDVSIRDGWFYHENEKPHSLERLANIYLESVGRNSVLLLNIPPDNHGRIAESDVARLMELRHWIDSNFSSNLLGKKQPVNAVVLSEDISNFGQRVEEFDVEILTNGQWQPVASATTIGKKRILMFEPQTPDSIRLNIKSSRNTPHAKIDGAYFVTMPKSEEALADTNRYVAADAVAVVGKANKQNLTLRYKTQQPISGFVYTPTTDPNQSIVAKCNVTMYCKGKRVYSKFFEFGNIEASPTPRTEMLDIPVNADRIVVHPVEWTSTKKPAADIKNTFKFFIP